MSFLKKLIFRVVIDLFYSEMLSKQSLIELVVSKDFEDVPVKGLSI